MRVFAGITGVVIYRKIHIFKLNRNNISRILINTSIGTSLKMFNRTSIGFISNLTSRMTAEVMNLFTMKILKITIIQI